MICSAQIDDMSKFSKTELIDKVIKAEQTTKLFQDSFSLIKKEKATQQTLIKTNLDKLNSSEKEIEYLKSVIKTNNEVFLTEVFQNKYTAEYFKEADLEIADKSTIIYKSNVLINSIRVGANKELRDSLKKAQSFNDNYAKLFEIRQKVLDVKYDSSNVKKALLTIDSLPILDSSSALNITKKKIRHLLQEYHTRTCELRTKLDKLFLAKDQKVLGQLYNDYEKNPAFMHYKYLVAVISRMKADPKTYNTDLLQPCNVKQEANPTMPETIQLKNETKAPTQ
jgi:hypothetical protein